MDSITFSPIAFRVTPVLTHASLLCLRYMCLQVVAGKRIVPYFDFSCNQASGNNAIWCQCFFAVISF